MLFCLNFPFRLTKIRLYVVLSVACWSFDGAFVCRSVLALFINPTAQNDISCIQSIFCHMSQYDQFCIDPQKKKRKKIRRLFIDWFFVQSVQHPFVVLSWVSTEVHKSIKKKKILFSSFCNLLGFADIDFYNDSHLVVINQRRKSA